LYVSTLDDYTITFTIDPIDAELYARHVDDTANKDTVVTLTLTSIADINAANDDNYGFSGTCETDGTNNVDYSVDDTNAGTTAVTGSVNRSDGRRTGTGRDTRGLGDDTITVLIDHTDAAGNSRQLSDTATKDAIVVLTITSIADINAANDDNYGFSGTCETDGTTNVDYSVDDTNAGTTAVTGSVN